jgi:hypothetical protein
MRGDLTIPGTEGLQWEGVLAPKRGFGTSFGTAGAALVSLLTHVNPPLEAPLLYVIERKSSNYPNLPGDTTAITIPPREVLAPPLMPKPAKTPPCWCQNPPCGRPHPLGGPPAPAYPCLYAHDRE